MITFKENFPDLDENGCVQMNEKMFMKIQLNTVLEGLEIGALICDEHADYDTDRDGRMIGNRIKYAMANLKALYADAD